MTGIGKISNFLDIFVRDFFAQTNNFYLKAALEQW